MTPSQVRGGGDGLGDRSNTKDRILGHRPSTDVSGTDGCHLDPITASHQAHRFRHGSVPDIRLQNLMQVSHESIPFVVVFSKSSRRL
jgi:hypothetical protein